MDADQANYYRAVMRAEHRTEEIDDLEAFRILTGASRNVYLTKRRQDEANFFCIRMWLLHWADKISNPGVFKFLTDFSQIQGAWHWAATGLLEKLKAGK